MYRICNSEAVGGANNDAYGYVETDPSGRYGRFKEVLGKGATKTVYKAFDEMLGLEVAWNQVKLIGEVFKSPDELHRLYSEVHLLKNLCHDSIIRFFTSWVDADLRTFNFVTEMFTSGSLREYRQRYKRVQIRVVKNWARQILHGLAYLHSHDPPVIHRDLKCDNIFVNGHLGQVKIGDLGLAAILRGSHNAHSVIGTPEFMAPEVYEEEYNELVDIYSFGMCVLEMLTSEYPYSECTNPAQIYKKVTSGKLPNAFYKIQDVEAKKFVGKCLESAAKRLTAKEILLDPFLALHDDGQNLPIPNDNIPAPLKPNSSGREKIIDDKTIPQPRSSPTAPLRSTAMTITGTMNPYESDAVFLKVQICNNSNGQARNIYFPFGVMNDTAANVAAEMVNELEIKDWEPSEIAFMIEDEISSLLPSWNHRDDDSFSYDEEDYDGYDVETHHHPQCRMSSHSPFSSQTFLPALCTSIRPAANNASSSQDWFQNTLFANDDVSSPDSLSSHKYSNLNYDSADFKFDADFDLSSRRRVDPPFTTTSNIHSTRFCPAGSLSATNCYKQGGGRSGSHKQPKLCRMRSLLDVRSQLLHRSLVEEIHKRRLFKTVGAVENIGFQEPKGEFPGSPAG